MIYITQLIYIIKGEEHIFDKFEKMAIPIISKYNGSLLLRVRPTESSFIEDHIDRPYEVHLVAFKTQEDFENFTQDEERKKFLYLKERSVKASLIISGTKL